VKLTASTAATYAAMLGKLLPRGPIWDGAQAALGALLTALGAELNEVHARLVQVMEEAYPNTADETLSDWLRVWGLPGPCSTMPATDDGKRELLAGKVAAQGGQSRAYYIGIVRAILGDLEAVVTITERPYGTTLYAWSGSAWDTLGYTGGAHFWRVTLPSGVTDTQLDAIDCVLQAFKPAHTVLVLRSTTCSGGGDPADLVISDAASYDFGNVAAGAGATHVFTLTNIGLGSASDVNAFVLSGPFRVTSRPSLAIASAGSATVGVEFGPDSVGPFSTYLTVEYCDGTQRVTTTRLMTGTGT